MVTHKGIQTYAHHQQPKSLRAGLGWCVASVPLPSGPNTGSNPGEERVLKKNKKNNFTQNHDFWFGFQFMAQKLATL